MIVGSRCLNLPHSLTPLAVKLVEGVIGERVDAFDLRDGEIEGEEVKMNQWERR